MHKIITIIGPTATGKSDLAVKVALYIKKTYNIEAEIISTDSRQLYKHLDIGTGKITKEEMHGVPHHMLDIVDPDNSSYSVFKFGQDAKKIIDDMHARAVVPILCGGTGFYIDAVVFGNIGADTIPYVDEQNELETLDIFELQHIAKTLSDEKSIDISHVDTTNKRRLARAITILRHDGVFAKPNTKPLYETLYLGLDTSTEKLRARIQKRIEARLQSGMIEESEKLLEQGNLTHTRMQKLGLEYKFISEYIQKKITLAEFTEKLFFAIWHYAKRQRVWFKKYLHTHWFDADTTQKDATPVFEIVHLFLKK